MAGDIEKAVQNHCELSLSMKRMSDRVTEVGRERALFMAGSEKLRGQIKEFENFMNEARTRVDTQMISLRKEVS